MLQVLLPLSQGAGGGCRGDCALAGGVAGAGQCRLASMAVAGGQLLATLPTWGPEYSLAFNLVIHSYHANQWGWAELIRFTNQKQDNGIIGARIPTIFLNKPQQALVFCTQIGQNANWHKYIPLNTKTCYSIELVQYEQNMKVYSGSLMIHIISFG